MRRLLAHRQQVLTYLAGGLASAAIDIGLMQLLLWLGQAPMLAVTVGFVCGLLFNFTFHARVTFQQAGSGAAFARYLTVIFGNYLLTMALVEVALRLGGTPLPGKLVALVLAALNGFLFGKFWIFK